MRTPRHARHSRPGDRTLHAVISGLILVLGLPLREAAWAQPVGAEFHVNTITIGHQSGPAVAADADGDFVVVWQSDSQDGSLHRPGVFGRRYTSAGAAVGIEFLVNTYTTEAQARPNVAAEPDGGFVVVWDSYSQDGSSVGVFGQRYTSAGAAVGTEFQVNTYTTRSQWSAAVAADADGDFVVVWTSSDFGVLGPDGQDGNFAGVFGQRYTSAGAAVGGEFQVNTYTTDDQRGAAVAADADGNFVVVWTSDTQDGSLDGVFGQRYASTGAAIGGEFQVNTVTVSRQRDAGVAADADGDFVVVWISCCQDGSFNGVFGQRYASTGAAVGGEFQVNTYTTLEQLEAEVAADADGNFVVVWSRHIGEGFVSTGIFGQRYTSAGAPVGAEFQVNTYTPGPPSGVAADADGDFVVIWTSQDGFGAGVVGQRFQPIVPTTTIPALSPVGGLLLGVLLPMLWGFRRRVAGAGENAQRRCARPPRGFAPNELDHDSQHVGWVRGQSKARLAKLTADCVWGSSLRS